MKRACKNEHGSTGPAKLECVGEIFEEKDRVICVAGNRGDDEGE